jgi:hypothetical protein
MALQQRIQSIDDIGITLRRRFENMVKRRPRDAYAGATSLYRQLVLLDQVNDSFAFLRRR